MAVATRPDESSRLGAGGPPSPAAPGSAPERPYADRGLITAGVICLVGIAVTHLLDMPGHIQDAPYIAVLFGLLATASFVLALALTKGVWLRLVWPVAGALAFVTIIAYVYSRTLGLPQIEDHIGEWRDSVGSASLVFEALLVALSLPALRPRALRFAPAASLIAAGLVVGALLTGEASGHDHMAGGHMHAGMNVDTATPAQQAWGRQHIQQALASAKQRFPTFAAARAAGYVFSPRSYRQQKGLDFWHLTNLRYQSDSDYLDPQRPESLMYWNNPDGKPVLVAYVYRLPRDVPNPTAPGPLFMWHLHHNGNRQLGKRKMVHLWLLPTLKGAFSTEMPLKQLARRYGTPIQGGTGAGVTG